MTSYEFDWKANRNFCVTAKHSCDFEGKEADEARENDKFFEFALKLEHDFGKSTFRLVGYYKTERAAETAITNTHFQEYAFMWNRKGECVDGAY